MERINAVDLRTEDSSALTVTSPTRLQRSQRLMTDLASLAEARQVALSQQTYQVYGTVLGKHAPEDVHQAIVQLLSEPRPQYGPAFPELGAIVALAERARQQRVAPPRFVPCGQCINGLTYVDAQGQPCDVSASPRRLMAPCECRRAWMEERRRRTLIAEAA